VLPQKVYTYILSCSDLNFTWSDDLKQDFYFIKWVEMEDYYKQLANVIDKYIILNMPTLSLAMRHSDGSDIGELFL